MAEQVLCSTPGLSPENMPDAQLQSELDWLQETAEQMESSVRAWEKLIDDNTRVIAHEEDKELRESRHKNNEMMKSLMESEKKHIRVSRARGKALHAEQGRRKHRK